MTSFGRLKRRGAIASSFAAGLIAACASVPHASVASAAEGVLCSTLLEAQYSTFEMQIASPTGRSVPLSVFSPQEAGEYPLIVFSHGNFAAPDRYEKMLGPLAAAGFVVIAPMHIDSEEFERAEPAAAGEVWQTRNEDFRASIESVPLVESRLAKDGVEIDRKSAVAMGHSYGALMAQLAGGAQAIETDGTRPDRRAPEIDAVVAWSPPGAIPGRMDAASWSALQVPTLTITGTADILPGFIDDWHAHKASYKAAPEGSAWLWVGEGVDHYFGGMFGREKPVDDNSRAMFSLALQRSLAFIQSRTGHTSTCAPSGATDGETYETR